MRRNVSDTVRPGQKWWEIDCVILLLLFFGDYSLALGLYIYPECILFSVFKVYFCFPFLSFTFIGRVGQ